MLRNYFTIARRNLLKNKISSIINIGGLAAGMAVAILIGLWIYDECSFNKHFDNYDRLGKLWQFVKFDKTKDAYPVMPIPIAAELRTKYPDFQAISLASETQSLPLQSGDKKITRTGAYVEPVFTDMFSLQMLSGNRHALADQQSILLDESLAKSIFGDKNALGQTIRIGNNQNVKVAGIYKDLPVSTDFDNYHFLVPWNLYVHTDSFVAKAVNDWDNNDYQVFAQLKPGASFAALSAKIKETRMLRSNPPAYHPEFFVFPMSRWHLYGDFYDGVNTGGLITFVWLFAIIGAFVLLLACINFMNLSTARSERRAKEVGIRKAIGSLRIHLIGQFLNESIMVALIAFALATLLARVALPFFNDISDKKMHIPWENNKFWLAGLGFSLLTGLIAGSYPALYLSSFRPVTVLKGTFKAGRLASIPRKVLVVLQFSVSVCLIIGTLVVLRQIQYTKDRSTGYNRNNLIEVDINTPELYEHARAIQTALLASGAAENLSASSCPITSQNGGTTALSWPGKRDDQHNLILSNRITPEFGKTIGWHVITGRDFSRAFGNDSAAIIINEAAEKLMDLKKPLGQTLTWSGTPYHIIGVTADMIRQSPFGPVDPSFFVLGQGSSTIQIKLPAKLPTADALAKTAAIFHQYNPGSPFTYSFVDDEFAKKFNNEERIGKIAGFFAALAVFISCLGLYGLVSFIAEQRTREIGMRKILGASVFNVWKLLSKEFLLLVTISLFIAIPVAWYFMHGWLLNYDYRAPLSWYIFAAAAMGALSITLLTVSVEAIKAALANPIKSLRTE
jgi:putative ABC transport system permease protein